jgi:long-subunit acyl-CoA synthetase (AMP-forming)
LVYQLQDSEAKLILVGPEATGKAIEAANVVGIPTSRVLSFCEIYEEANRPQPGGLQPWTSIWADEEEVRSWSWRKITTKEEAQNTTIVINYSSGTTGYPKGVEISHYNLIANAEQVNHKRNLVANTPKGRARKARLQVSGDRWLAAVPMYHAYVSSSP